MTPNPLQLDFRVLPGTLPPQAHLRAETLAAHLAGADLLTQAQAEAAQLRTEAAAVLAEALLEAEAIRADARRAAAAERANLQSEARAAAVAQAVQWLVHEQELEQLIARQLALRWRGLTASVLHDLLGKADQTELLLRRVERKVFELLPQEQLSLHVAPSAVGATARVFAATPQVQVVGDDQLAAGQARLDNGLVRIHFDLPAHQHWLLEQLSGDTRRLAHA